MIRLPIIRIGSSKWITHTLLLSIIPVILFGTIIYQLGSRIVQDEIHRSSQESLSQVKSQVESKMKSIEEMTNQIALQTDIMAVMNIGDTPKLGADPRTNEIRNQLSKLKNVTDTVRSIYFYHMKQGLVITDDLVTDMDQELIFRDLSWLENVDQLTEARQHQMWVSPREMTSLNGEITPTLSLIRLLPLLYNQPKAAIIVNLNPDFLVSAISEFPLGSDGRLLVLNDQNELIAQTASASLSSPSSSTSTSSREESTMELGDYSSTEEAGMELGGYSSKQEAAIERYDYLPKEQEPVAPGVTHTYRSGHQFLSVLKSEKNGWTYIMAVPSNVPREQVEDFRRMIIGITVILCLLVVYSAYFTHSRFQGSIRSLMERLSLAKSDGDSASNSGDIMAEMEKHVTRLMSEVKEGKSQQETQLPLLRNHYLHALLHGNAVDISRLARHSGEEAFFPYDSFCIMAAQMDESAEGSFAKEQALFLFAVSNIATELPRLRQLEQCRIEAIQTYQYAVFIINYDRTGFSEEEAVDIADQLRSIVKKILKHTITIGVGTPAYSAHDVSYSYREALQALQMNGMHARDEVLPYQNMTLVAAKLAQYPSAEEQELLNALRARDEELAERSLERFDHMLESHLTSFHMAKTFYLQLLVAVIRLIQEYEEDIGRVFEGGNPYEEFFRMEELSRIREWFRNRLLHSILNYMEQVKRQRTEHVVKRTTELIHERYQHDLSLQAAAEAVGISASYLSQLFKDELGVTFIEYVTSVRVEKAQRLLVDTDLTLQQIADAIGYTSVQQLFRVFKKRHGMTPGEYRERNADV
ncbi:helix-turn-helix domain-containing protein [Paenibacillus sp. HB172176]|uniref:helix-turn-helix domain-containing protein n=1 Tax=Paenibacillus sp. HB172176 TaxID=2493690 RepID=UPI001438A34E|nr:helix-turn-helix domain-containing protein [Paenibacillus sp. HB172176]